MRGGRGGGRREGLGLLGGWGREGRVSFRRVGWGIHLFSSGVK